jgi:hypothetical protein
MVNNNSIDEAHGRWEWNESRNEWRLYDAKTQKLLNKSYKNNEDKVSISDT